jgi:hypothetical protein
MFIRMLFLVMKEILGILFRIKSEKENRNEKENYTTKQNKKDNKKETIFVDSSPKPHHGYYPIQLLCC